MITRQDYPTYTYLHSELVITNWDKQDIKTYKGDKNVYLEPNADISSYYEITEAEHFAYEKQKEEAEHPDFPTEVEEVEEVKA